MAKGEIQEVNQSIEKQHKEEAAVKIQKFVRKKQQKNKEEEEEEEEKERKKKETGSSPPVFKTEVPPKQQVRSSKPNFNRKR